MRWPCFHDWKRNPMIPGKSYTYGQVMAISAEGFTCRKCGARGEAVVLRGNPNSNYPRVYSIRKVKVH